MNQSRRYISVKLKTLSVEAGVTLCNFHKTLSVTPDETTTRARALAYPSYLHAFAPPTAAAGSPRCPTGCPASRRRAHSQSPLGLFFPLSLSPSLPLSPPAAAASGARAPRRPGCCPRLRREEPSFRGRGRRRRPLSAPPPPPPVPTSAFSPNYPIPSRQLRRWTNTNPESE